MPWPSGKSRSEITKQKMSVALRGKCRSEETKRKMHKPKSKEHAMNISRARIGKSRPDLMGENNPNWKADNIGITQLHNRIKKLLSKTEFCQICKLVPPQELSNKTGLYNMDLRNWWWLCCRCHVYYDGTVNNLKHRSKI